MKAIQSWCSGATLRASLDQPPRNHQTVNYAAQNLQALNYATANLQAVNYAAQNLQAVNYAAQDNQAIRDQQAGGTFDRVA